MLDESIQLVGERAKLMTMEQAHVEALFEAGRFLDIWSYMPIKVETMQDMSKLVEQAIAAKRAGREFPFVVIDNLGGRIVGSTRFLDISEANRHVEIGWTWLTPDVWRTRINTECKYLLLKYCFEVLGLIRVQIKTDKRNSRSQEAIERIGGVKEGVLRKHRILSDGYVRDSVYYSVIDDEWPTVKLNLETMLRR